MKSWKLRPGWEITIPLPGGQKINITFQGWVGRRAVIVVGAPSELDMSLEKKEPLPGPAGRPHRSERALLPPKPARRDDSGDVDGNR